MKNVCNYIYDDGGRSTTRKGYTGDCSVRALAIASDMDYEDAYRLCKSVGFDPQKGLGRKEFNSILSPLGWDWISCSAVKGSPRVKLHELTGTCIARVSKHFVAIVDGVVRDTFDARRLPDGRCVYGFWRLKND